MIQADRQVRRGGHEVGQEKRCVAAAGELRTHFMSRMCPGARIRLIRRERFRLVSVKQMPLAGGFDGLEIFRDIAGAIAIGGIARVFEFAARGRYNGRWGMWAQPCRRSTARVPAAMVEVQMGVDDDIDFLGPNAIARLADRGGAGAFEGVDVAALGVPFIARAGLDEDPLPCRANQQQFMARRMRLRSSAGRRAPTGLGDDAEHGAAVEAERAVGRGGEFEVAEFHALVPLCISAPRCEQFAHGGVGTFCGVGNLRAKSSSRRASLSVRPSSLLDQSALRA